MFSRACEYGIRSCIFIANQSSDGTFINLKSIAYEIDSPVAFTAKILQKLVKHNIVRSSKGPTGGFNIDSARLKEIKLKDIVFAIDGDEIYTACSLGMKECSEIHPCPVHNQYKYIKNGIMQLLETTDLLHLCSGLDNGSTYLKITEQKA